jgi:hypothetical protein
MEYQLNLVNDFTTDGKYRKTEEVNSFSLLLVFITYEYM